MTFAAVDDGTRVTITHAGLPATHTDRHTAGWGHFLSVLAEVCAGGVAPEVNLPAVERADADSATLDRTTVDRITREVRHGERR